MRQVIVLTLCLCMSACAQAKTGEPSDPVDLAVVDPLPDLVDSNLDMVNPLPDQRGRDLSGTDLSDPRDLSTPDLRGPLPDLSSADLTSPTYPRINEVAPGVGGVELDEYIELIGGDMDTGLFGWSLRYQPAGGGTSENLLSFPFLTILPAHRYMLIAATGSTYITSADQTYTSTASGRMTTSGGAVALFNVLTKIDSVGWGTAVGSYVEGVAAPGPGGQSCSRLPDGADSDRNQIDFQVTPTTPRSPNHP